MGKHGPRFRCDKKGKAKKIVFAINRMRKGYQIRVEKSLDRFFAKTKGERGELVMAIAIGVLAAAIFFSFWRIHDEEKQPDLPMGGVEEKLPNE